MCPPPTRTAGIAARFPPMPEASDDRAAGGAEKEHTLTAEGLSRTRAIVVDPVALGAAEARAWDQLSDRSADPNPFLRRAFVEAAAKNLAGDVELMTVQD